MAKSKGAPKFTRSRSASGNKPVAKPTSKANVMSGKTTTFYGPGAPMRHPDYAAKLPKGSK